MSSCEAILTTAYLPNIQYMSKILGGRPVLIEIQDTYQKQSYRNRATILGANGPLDLIIPVKRPFGNRTKTCDVLLDYDTHWMQIHWKAIVSAYKHSPFFDIFEEEFCTIYQQRKKYLIDWNSYILETIATITGESLNINYTKIYEKISGNSLNDYRTSIHPKRRMQEPDPYFDSHPYFQVFSNKFGFIPNLSFVDLLFNEGPQAAFLCRSAYKKDDISHPKTCFLQNFYNILESESDG